MTIGDAGQELTRTAKAPVRRSRQALSEESASYVRALIMSGELREGEFVRLERIAAEMGISVTPAREGLLLLLGEGFVVLEPRRGFMVAPLSPEDVADLFYVQATIAGELAARAARLMTDDDLARVDQFQNSLSESLRMGDNEAVAEFNYQLHRTINRSAQAPKLAWFLGLSVRYVPTRFFSAIAGWEEASAHDHAAVIATLRERNAEGARAAMSEHIQHAGDLLVAHLGKNRGQAYAPTGQPAQDGDAPVGPGSGEPA